MPPLIPLRTQFHRVAVLFRGRQEHMPVIFVSPAVLDAIDTGAANGDPALSNYRRELEKKLKVITAPTHHQGFSQFFEQYSEALAYLLLTRRGLQLERITESPNKSPDFRTSTGAPLYLEVKTLDFAAAPCAHERTGKSTATKVLEQKKQRGLQTTASAIRPHGNARTSFEAIRKVTPRVERNYKPGQFQFGPTFLVLPLNRTAIHADSCSLASWYTQYGFRNTGQLWAVAANRAGEDYWEEGRVVGKLPDTGILRRRTEIAGIIFVRTEWHRTQDPDALDRAFHLQGLWNSQWRTAVGVGRYRADQIKKVLIGVCDAYNDTNDRRRVILARLCPAP